MDPDHDPVASIVPTTAPKTIPPQIPWDKYDPYMRMAAHILWEYFEDCTNAQRVECFVAIFRQQLLESGHPEDELSTKRFVKNVAARYYNRNKKNVEAWDRIVKWPVEGAEGTKFAGMFVIITHIMKELGFPKPTKDFVDDDGGNDDEDEAVETREDEILGEFRSVYRRAPTSAEGKGKRRDSILE